LKAVQHVIITDIPADRYTARLMLFEMSGALLLARFSLRERVVRDALWPPIAVCMGRHGSDNLKDDELRQRATPQRLLDRDCVIAVIGSLNQQYQPSYSVSAYMKALGYRIVPVDPRTGTMTMQPVLRRRSPTSGARSWSLRRHFNHLSEIA
jgi:hypothetical protein